MLPALMGVMKDFAQPRVQAHAAAAVVNFSENCDQDILPPYLDDLITHLLQLLQNGKRIVQVNLVFSGKPLDNLVAGMRSLKKSPIVSCCLEAVLNSLLRSSAHMKLCCHDDFVCIILPRQCCLF